MTPLDDQPTVLLTESDPVVGLDLADALEKAGYRVLGPVQTTAEALSLLETQTPSLAVLDPGLADGRSSELAGELHRRGVPFLIHSDHQQAAALGGGFNGVPWLPKPAPPWDVVTLLDELSLSGGEAEVRDPTRITPVRLVDQTTASGNPFVRKLEGFTTLSPADRARLEAISAGARIVPPGTDLVREGDAPDGVVLVMDGFASRHKHRANGARQIMAYLIPGDLGDIDAAHLDRMDHTITTLSACKVVRVAPDSVAELMAQPAIARGLRKSTLVDAATLREWLVNIGCRSAQERIAHLLCELLVRLQAVGLASENSYELPITQIDLADTTGLSNVHVNRSLQALRRQKLLELKSKRSGSSTCLASPPS